MKNLFVILMSLVVMASCNTNTSNKDEQDTVKALEENFKTSNPDAKDVSWEMNGDLKEVEFTENGVKKSIVYDNNGKVIESETEINIDELSEPILTYIGENYPEAEIEGAEKVKNLEGIFFEVEIETENDEEIELLFSEDGTFVKSEIENEDEGEEAENEVEIDQSELPAAVLEYVSQNYSSYTITEAEKETTEKGTFFEIELTSPDGAEMDLVFDLEGNFIEIEED